MLRPAASPRMLADASGFTLIEILVALLILSIGLLGLAALQITSLQNSQASYERSIAVMQANDLVERMWAGICDLHDEDGEFVEAQANAIKAAWEDQHEDTLGGLGWTSPPLGYDDTISGTAGTVVELQIRWNERTPMSGEPGAMQFTHYFRLPRVNCAS